MTRPCAPRRPTVGFEVSSVLLRCMEVGVPEQAVGPVTKAYSDYESLRVERLGDVLRVAIANPRNRMNAVDGQLHQELGRLFGELKREQDARAVVITGSGRAFS